MSGICVFVYKPKVCSDMNIEVIRTQNERLVPTHLDLYTILLLPILYGAWHTNGRSEGLTLNPFPLSAYPVCDEEE